MLVLAACGVLSAAEPAAQPSSATVVPSSDGALAGLLAQADDATTAGRFDEAQVLLQRARDLAPQDPRVQTRLTRLAAVIQGRSTDPAAAPPAVLTTWALAEITQARNRAAAMERAGRFEDALEQLEVVRQNLRIRSLDQGDEVRDALLRLDGDATRIRDAQRQAEIENGSAERDRLLAEARGRTSDETQRNASLRAELLARIRDLQAHGHHELALSETRSFLDRFPDDAEATVLYRDLLARTHRDRKLSTEQDLDEIRQELSERLGRNLMPTGFDGMPIYPSDFALRHAGNEAAAAAKDPAWKDALRDTLRTRTAVSADGQNGIEVLTALATAAHLNLIISPTLSAGPEHPVTIHAPSISLEHALTWICTQMETRWTLTRGAVWVGQDPEASEATLAIYDLSVLVAGAADQPGRTLGIGSTAGGADGGPGALFTTDKTEAKPPSIEEIVDLMKSTINPAVWEQPANGITVRGNLLYVSAPSDVHHLIGEFIRSQEQLRNLLVKVDTRWVVLSDDFLEEIGVDWSVGNTLVAAPGLTNGILTNQPNYTISGSSGHALPASAATRAGALSGKGLNLSWGLIGPLQLNAVLTAAETTTRARVVQAPSVTTINGVRANVFVGNETSYISDYEISSSNLDPKISNLTTGVSLDVKPFVSADRRYVTLDFRPAVTSATFFVETINAPRPGILNNGDGRNPLQPIPVVAYPLELPNLTVREAGTTLTVPDRGSALIGGFSKALTQSTGTRVPFLGDVPYLGRLFGRRGTYSEHDRLYLLATLTIISYDEQEAKL